MTAASQGQPTASLTFVPTMVPVQGTMQINSFHSVSNWMIHFGCIAGEISSILISQQSTSSLISGGWRPIDLKDAGAKRAAKYAVSLNYPQGTVTYKIVEAKYASCAEAFPEPNNLLIIRYYLVIAVTSITTKTCIMRDYVIKKSDDPKATPQYGTYYNQVLTSRKCPKK